MIFLFSLCFFNNFFTILADIENSRLKLELAIPIGAPITVANDVTELLPLVVDKTIKDLSKQSKEAIYLLKLLLISSLSVIFAIKWSLISLILFSLNYCWSFKFGYILFAPMELHSTIVKINHKIV